MPPKKKLKSEEKSEPVPVEDQKDLEETSTLKKRGRGRPKKTVTAGMKRPVQEDSRPQEEEEEYVPANTAEVAKGPGSKTKKKKASVEETDNGEPSVAESKTEEGRKKGKGVSKSAKNGSATEKVNNNVADIAQLDFSSSATTKDGKPWTLKFSSWNVNGIRAWLKNKGFEYVKRELPDIFCLQETKCDESELPHNELQLEGYKSYWSSAEQKGYSGTGLYSKKEPLNVTYGIGVEEHDKEGRVITAEFEKFYFVTSYVPNAGEKLKRLDYRVGKWDPAFKKYLKTLDDTKPVILCGDLNVAHHEIDLANPKTNLKTSGFTKEERESFTTLLEENNLVDTFRYLYPERKEAYSYWSYRSNARKNNKGWRLDYFLVSQRITNEVCDHVIRAEVMGSDHCPIVLFMAL